MIFGECPHCDGAMLNAMPDRTPSVYKAQCDHCGLDVWILASRAFGCEAYANRPSFLDDPERGWEGEKCG